jgi:sirohydrochlorin ferrochelatase
MAHGGTPEWDAAIAEATAPLARELPMAVAYGMADAGTLAHALDSLRTLGVGRVAVVRMFVSGASFIDQTEYLLGLSPTPPAFFAPSHGSHGGHAAADAGPPRPIAHGMQVATHLDGMVDAEEVHAILAGRALAMSRDPGTETVLLIAHGMGDPVENDALLSAMRGIEQRVAETPFYGVRSATLREDWAEARAIAEREIRGFVEEENRAGRRVLVVPVRLSGSGPYADVLEGLSYQMGDAVLPHDEVATWLRRVADRVARENGWGEALGPERSTLD